MLPNFEGSHVTITRTIYHLITKSIYFVDPDGNGFELYCNDDDNGLERLRRGEASASTRLNLQDGRIGGRARRSGSLKPAIWKTQKGCGRIGR